MIFELLSGGLQAYKGSGIQTSLQGRWGSANFSRRLCVTRLTITLSRPGVDRHDVVNEPDTWRMHYGQHAGARHHIDCSVVLPQHLPVLSQVLTGQIVSDCTFWTYIFTIFRGTTRISLLALRLAAVFFNVACPKNR